MAESQLEMVSKPSGWEKSRFIEGRTTPQDERLLRELAEAIENGSTSYDTISPLRIVGGLTGLVAIVEGCALGITYHAGTPQIVSDYLANTGFKDGSISSLPRRTGPHRGIDIDVPMGYPVLAAANGVVIFSGWDCCGGGNTITIEHGKDVDGDYIRTVYIHNESNLVNKGEQIKRGQRIALSGKSGELSGDYPHLHFGVHKGKKPNVWDKTWRHVNPHNYWFGIDEHKKRAEGKSIGSFVIPCFDPQGNYQNSLRFTYPVECKMGIVQR